MKILLTGGTGFIGKHLSESLLKEGHTLIQVTRKPRRYKARPQQTYVTWEDALNHDLYSVEAVINLAGENLFDQRWSSAVKKQLYDSRVKNTARIVEAMGVMKKKPKVFISASAVGIYGDQGAERISEKYPAANDFLAKLCVDWEREAMVATQLKVRVVIPRIGIVLHPEGGVLQKLKLPFSMYVGGALGSGTQYVPWIHMTDLVNSIVFALNTKELSGVYNATAPEPISMNELCMAYGSRVGKPSWFNVPKFVLNLALGESSNAILSSLRVLPEHLLRVGYQFQFETIDKALTDLM